MTAKFREVFGPARSRHLQTYPTPSYLLLPSYWLISWLLISWPADRQPMTNELIKCLVGSQDVRLVYEAWLLFCFVGCFFFFFFSAFTLRARGQQSVKLVQRFCYICFQHLRVSFTVTLIHRSASSPCLYLHCFDHSLLFFCPSLFHIPPIFLVLYPVTFCCHCVAPPPSPPVSLFLMLCPSSVLFHGALLFPPWQHVSDV